MILKDFSRISKPNDPHCKGAIDIRLMQQAKIVGVGAGGAYCLYDALTRSGLGQLTVIDFDEVEEVNIVRQGFETTQIGMKKVDALGEHLNNVNAGLKYEGISRNIFDMNESEQDRIFGDADILLFLTDSFKAQAFGNKLALRYGKPAIWAGFYEKSQCAEIVFTIPGVTPACFRCAVSSRYEAQAESREEILVSSGCNTMMHSQLLDSFKGMIIFGILHNNIEGYEYSNWFGSHWDRNLIQIKVNPRYPSQLFQKVFEPTDGRCPNFSAIWQRIEEERPPKYVECPDCNGIGNLINCKQNGINKNE
ncbi:MAG: ThiF family adenylyltransferase [Saprospiraceae bacterium]|nr:ThiF family adenylyltransferase [Saprospiraceae bacterium]